MYQPQTITQKQLVPDGSYPVYGANGVMGRYDRYNHEAPQLVLGCRGACGSIHITAPQSWITGNSMVIQPNLKLADIHFIRYFLEGPAHISSAITGAAQPQITQTSLRPLEVPLPPLDEQKRIVAVLDQAFAALDRARARVAANSADAKELFQRTLSVAFDDENGLEVEMRSLFDIGSSKRVLKAQWVTQGVPFYRGREVTALSREGSVDNQLFITEEHFAELEEKYGVPTAGDIIITAIGTIGNAYIVQDRDRFYFKDASVLWMKKSCDVSSEYVLAWLRSPRFFEQLDTGNGATVDTLTIQKLQSIKIPLPGSEQQERTVATLDAMRAQVEKLKSTYERQLADIVALRQSLLQAAFSGLLT